MSVDVDMVAYPNRVVPKTSRWNVLAILLLSVGLTSVGVVFRADEKWWGWPMVIGFGLLVLVFGVQLVKPGTLTISPDGLRSGAFGSRGGVFYRWDELDDFRVMELYGNHVVRMSRTGLLLPGTLSSSYGQKPAVLTAFLNRYREAALRG